MNSKYLQTLEKLEILGYQLAESEEKFNSLRKLLESANTSKLTTLKVSFAGFN